MIESTFSYDSVEMSPDGREVIILDQSLLPAQEKFLHMTTSEQVFFAITLQKVRGPIAVGLAAAFGLAVSLNRFKANNLKQLETEFIRIKRSLYINRPNTATLLCLMDRMEACFFETKSKIEPKEKKSIEVIKNALLAEARSIKLEDVKKCQSISESGAELINRGDTILTFGNAGHLATARYGTALGPIYVAQQKGFAPKVYTCETRPMLYGSRLMAYELNQAGIDVTLICDDMAAVVLSQKKIDKIFVGADRVAANGDVVSVPGTNGLAIIAKHYNIPFYVLVTSDTLSSDAVTGDDFQIDESPAYEITEMYFSKPVAPKGIKVYNPSYDITDSSLVKAYITDKGVFKKPEQLKNIISDDTISQSV